MSLLFNLRPTLKKELDELRPTLGFCILIDMVGSTTLKDKGLNTWPMRIFNTFSLVRNYLSGFQPLKCLGDSLMFYVPEAELKDHGQSVLSLFLALCYTVQEEDKRFFGATKIAATYCQNAYEITFMKDTRDIYGKDIDLTSRLMSMASEREIIMNEAFVQQVRAKYEVSIQRDFPDVPKIMGPWPQHLKGFADYVNIYKLPAGGTSLTKQMGASGGVF